ncbi:hypothetical protein [Leucobacter musarum]|uniref:hypothetical protein n=1 Tax=Leucobacter musarum TaxID=1930747 RepID=UPI0006A76AC3|nr:hypothetical protein [Leucobacter musarum]
MFMLEDQIELGCTPGIEYPMCVGAESTARGMGSFIGWLAETVLGAQEFAPGTTLWDNAIGEASNWFAIAIIVMLITGIVGLATGMVSMKPRRLWASVGGIAAAIPSTYIALAVGGTLLTLSDQLSELALTRIGGDGSFENLFRMVLQNGTGTDLGGALLGLTGFSGAAPMLLLLVGILLGLILMSFALAFRNLGLMILIAFAPLAFMAVPMKGGWEIVKKWALAGIALLLAKPLMFGVLAMLLKSSEGMALFSSQTLTVMTGLFVVSFMPMMAYSFFSFLGAGNENMAGQGMASHAGQKAAAPVQRVTGAVTSKAGGAIGGAFGRIFQRPDSASSTGRSAKPRSTGNQPGGGTPKQAGSNQQSTNSSGTSGNKPSSPGGTNTGRSPGGAGKGAGSPQGAGAPGGSPQVPAAPTPNPGAGSKPRPGAGARPGW